MYTGTLDRPVVVAGPIFLEGGLYHFKVRVLTLDDDTLYYQLISKQHTRIR